MISQHGAIEPGQYFVRRRAAPSPILGIATGPPLNVNNMPDMQEQPMFLFFRVCSRQISEMAS